MSRFGNLEFDSDWHGQTGAQPSSGADEQRVLAEALEFFAQADFEQALRRYAKALEFGPVGATAWTGQVRALIEMGEFHEAKLWADKALERFPTEPELLAAKAVALGRLGDGEGALAFSDASIAEHGDTPYVWLARGDVLLARRERRADFCFEKALVLAAKDWFTAWLAARIRAFHRQFSLALKLTQQALEWQADRAALWLLAGDCQRELGLVAAARHSYQQALQLDPAFRPAERALAQLTNPGLGARLGGWWRRLSGA